MTKVIIYPQDSGTLALVFPTGEIAIEEVARKDVPTGIPYIIVDKSDLPEESFDFSDAWETDFSSPDGYGIGQDAWFEEQKLKEVTNDNNQP